MEEINSELQMTFGLPEAPVGTFKEQFQERKILIF